MSGEETSNLSSLREENASVLFHPQAWFLSQAGRTGLHLGGQPLTSVWGAGCLPGDTLSLHLRRTGPPLQLDKNGQLESLWVLPS